MSENNEFGYRTRQILNEGTDALTPKLATRLHKARQAALDHQRVSARGHRVALAMGIWQSDLAPRSRQFVAAVALLIGAAGTFYWNEFQKAQEYEEIDSALLADELPPSAYLDRGFQAWLERASRHSSAE